MREELANSRRYHGPDSDGDPLQHTDRPLTLGIGLHLSAFLSNMFTDTGEI